LRALRKLVRVVLLLGATAVSYVALLAALGLLLPAPRWRRRGRNVVYHRWSRLCLRILGGRLRIEGSPPAAPFFLVSNHLSYVDIIVLASHLDVFFIAKLEIRSWPLFGLLTRTVGTIFVDRELRRDVVRVNKLIEDVLRQGYGVVLFPEGTSTQGAEVAEFRSALLDYPARTGTPVHAAALSYRTPPGEIPAHLGVSWWGDAPFGAHAWQLLGLRSFEALVRYSPRTMVGTDRKRLAEETRAAVAEVFEPVVDPLSRATDTGFSR
jgi:1-acyl-sn-glycerol-3-phosphate acyltransferase